MVIPSFGNPCGRTISIFAAGWPSQFALGTQTWQWKFENRWPWPCLVWVPTNERWWKFTSWAKWKFIYSFPRWWFAQLKKPPFGSMPGNDRRSADCYLENGCWNHREMGDTPNWGNKIGKWWKMNMMINRGDGHIYFEDKNVLEVFDSSKQPGPSTTACVKSHIPSRIQAIRMDLHSKSWANSPKVNCFLVILSPFPSVLHVLILTSTNSTHPPLQRLGLDPPRPRIAAAGSAVSRRSWNTAAGSRSSVRTWFVVEPPLWKMMEWKSVGMIVPNWMEK